MTKITLRYFKLSEFDSKDKPGSGAGMKESTLKRLDVARGIAGIPFGIISGVRTPAHNKKVGGEVNSAHLRGYAADIRVTSSANRLLILRACLAVGFNRIGIYKTFIHVDDDPSLPKNVMWVGGVD